MKWVQLGQSVCTDVFIFVAVLNTQYQSGNALYVRKPVFRPSFNDIPWELSIFWSLCLRSVKAVCTLSLQTRGEARAFMFALSDFPGCHLGEA